MADLPYDGGLGLSKLPQNSRRLDRAEAMRLVASVSYGRVVFTQNALPAIRPVNHLIDDNRVIIRTRLTATISSVVRSQDAAIVAYEADSFDPESRTGWSVVIHRTGAHHHRPRPDHALRTTAAPVGEPSRHRAGHRVSDRHRPAHPRHRGQRPLTADNRGGLTIGRPK